MRSLYLIFPPSGPFYSFLCVCRIKIGKKKSADGAPRSFVIYIIPLKRVMIGRRRHGTRENIIESNISSSSSSFSAEKMMRCTDTPTDPCVFSSSSFFEQKIYTEERSHRGNVCELKAADAETSRAFITAAVRDCGRKKTHAPNAPNEKEKKKKRKNGGDRLHDSLRTATASSSTCVGVRRREKKGSGCFMMLDNGHLKCDGRSAAKCVGTALPPIHRDSLWTLCRFWWNVFSLFLPVLYIHTARCLIPKYIYTCA